MAKPRAYQRIGDPGPFSRQSHVWYQRLDGSHICCLCGAVTRKVPPPKQEPEGWLPDGGYEPLTPALRGLFPFGERRPSEY